MDIPTTTPAVVPVLIGPLQVLLTFLPAILVAIGATIISLFKPRVIKQILLVAWRLKLPLAAGAVVLVALGWTAGALWPSGVSAAGAEQAGEDWSVGRGNLRRTGAAPGEVGPTRGGVNWTFRGDDEAFFSSPAVVGNRVYVASARLGMTARGGSGRVYCLDADTGAVVWEARPAGYAPTFSSPVVVGDYVLVGEGLHEHINSRVICLDRRTGEVLWEHRTACHVESTPVVHDGRVFIGAGDDGVHALALEGDGQGGAKVLWHAPGDQYPDPETSLIAHEGRLYVGLGIGGDALAVLDVQTGEQIKRISFPYPIFSPAAIDNGKLYVGMGTGDYVYTAEHFGQRPAGQMVRIDLASLEVEWVYPAGDTILGSPALTDEAVYFASRDGHVYCLSREGRLRWSWNAHTPFLTSPAVTERYVYAVASNGIMYILDREDGRPIAQATLGTQGLFLSSPAVARGQVYVGTQHDGLMSVGQVEQEQAMPLWPGPLGGPGMAGNPDGSPLPALGEFLWNYPADRMGDAGGTEVLATPAVLDGRLLLPLGGPQSGVAALGLQGSATSAPEPQWVYRTRNGVHHSPAARGGEVLLVDGQAGDAGRRLHSLDAASGQRQWAVDVEPQASGLFVVTPKEVFAQLAAGALAMVGPDGQVGWSRRTGELAAVPTPYRAMLLIVTAEGHLAALDRRSGQELWRVELDGRPRGMAMADRRVVFMPTSAGIEARSLVDGRKVEGWATGLPGASADLAATSRRLLYVSEAGELIVLSRADGGVRNRVEGARPGTVPLVGRERVLFHGPEAMMLWNLDDEGTPMEWMDVSWLGESAASGVLSGSRVYLPRSGWGVVVTGARP